MQTRMDSFERKVLWIGLVLMRRSTLQISTTFSEKEKAFKIQVSKCSFKDKFLLYKTNWEGKNVNANVGNL